MRGKPFEIGNKAGKGRPAGSRNKKSKYLDILEEYAEPLIKKGALMALNGDRLLLRACMDKLIPGAQPPVTRFRLPKGEGEPDMKQVLISVLKQTSTGQVSPQEAEFMARFVEGFLRAQAAIEHEGRLQSMEHYDSEQRTV
jgi:hypothetical protein